MENTELLQAISQMMEQQLKPINNRLENLEQRQIKLEQDMSEVKQRTTKVEVILENDISKKLGVLFDGHKLNTDKLAKLDTIEKTVNETKDKVDVISNVVQKHSREIKDLKLIK